MNLDEKIATYKKATLELYDKLIDIRTQKNKDKIDESLEKSAKNLKDNKFKLAIIGKVKAGKSTFINALLKKEIMSTDPIQATAAIIEIFYSPIPYIYVEYANGNIEKVEYNTENSFKEMKKKTS